MLTIKLKIQNSKICEVLCMAIVVGSRQKVGLLHMSATVNFDDSCFHFNAVKLRMIDYKSDGIISGMRL